ncbi:MAG: alcohol dehydrogenase catalytic domain-containing protein [Streptosporangiaceae bacterium]
MHAVVLTLDAQIALEERPEPVAGEGEVLIQVGVAGICGTDLHAPAMPSIFADNVVLGHEFSGTVVRGGRGVDRFEPGQPVVVNPIALSCGSCPACRRGLTTSAWPRWQPAAAWPATAGWPTSPPPASAPSTPCRTACRFTRPPGPNRWPWRSAPSRTAECGPGPPSP